jgi:hypothetical protein
VKLDNVNVARLNWKPKSENGKKKFGARTPRPPKSG